MQFLSARVSLKYFICFYYAMRVVAGLIHNPIIPKDLNLDYDTAELKYDVSPREKTVMWQITMECNYRCSYCVSGSHDSGNREVRNYRSYIDFFKKLKGKWHIIITGGGEPFLMKNLSDIINDLVSETQHTISLVTNLSISQKKLMHILDVPKGRITWLIGSLHMESVKVEDFFKKSIAVKKFIEEKGGTFVVNCVALKGRVSQLDKIGNKFRDAGMHFTLLPQKLKNASFVEHNEKEALIIQGSGRSHGLNNANFKGCRCFSGSEHVIINENGEVFWCSPAQREGNSKGYLGNVHDNVELLEKPVTCPYTLCSCVTPFDAGMIETPKDVSIIIPSYNRRKWLKVCLDSLFKQNYPKSGYEIIVVDDGSDDDTCEMVKKLKPTCDFKYIYWPRNKPYRFGEPRNRAGPARNVGIDHASGEILLFIDSDMIADKNLVREHHKLHENKDDLVVTGKRFRMEESDKVWEPCFDVADVAMEEDQRMRRFLDQCNGDFNRLKWPWAVAVSNNLSLKRKQFNEFFDTNFVYWGFEDLEFGYRCYLKGLSFVYNGRAIGYHIYHDYEHLDLKNKRLTIKKSTSIFYKKHLDRRIIDLFREYHDQDEAQRVIIPRPE